jgi:hypothetical protein
MRNLGSVAACFALAPSFAFADSWTGKLLDASCKVSNEGAGASPAGCSAIKTTRLFAIELPDGKVLNLDAAGSGKAADAVKNAQKAGLRAKVTGSLDGQTIKVETIEVQ